jgi:hypothetical protein
VVVEEAMLVRLAMVVVEEVLEAINMTPPMLLVSKPTA